MAAKVQVSVGFAPELLKAVDAYCISLPVPVKRSAAIESLVRKALQAENPQLDLALTGAKESSK